MVEDRDDARGVGAPPGRAGAWKRASRRCGTRRSRWSRSATPACPASTPRSCARPSGCSARRSRRPATGRSRGRELAPGGWAFEFANVNYPDVDDTAEVVLALLRVARRRPRRRRRRDAARDRARRVRAWVEGMQSSDGGWGAFDADNTRALVRELPFLDFGEVIDEPSADVTAHARRDARRARPARARPPRARGALAARAAGGRRVVVRALGRQPRLRHRRRGAGADRRRRRARRARASAARCAGSRSTRTRTAAGARTRAPTTTRRWIGRGPSTASQTAWALLALHAAGERLAGAARAASTGSSPPSAPTAAGTSRSTPAPGFPSDYYINYHLYRLVVPDRWRSARCVDAVRGAVSGSLRPAHPAR